MARQDDRGVSTLVGAILLFGIILVVYATWQAAVVPAENKQIEFDAFQEAGEDVTELQNALQRAGTFGVQTSAVVHVGARYPPRVLFVNPPPATGTLSTQSAGDVTFSNVTATDKDVRDYWNSSETTLAFDTHHVALRTDYNELRANDLGVDPSGAVYLAAGTNTVMRDAQSLVNGNRITLVTVAGGYREGGVSVSPSVVPVSVGTETISVRNANGNFTMTVPTRLSQSAWNDIASNQETVQSAIVSDNEVTITLSNGTYQLRLSRVALREPSDAPTDTELDARYIVASNPDAGPSFNGSPVRLTSYVRDRFNNPHSNVTVKFTAASEGSLQVGNPNGGSCSAVKPSEWKTSINVTSVGNGAAVACANPDSTTNKSTIKVTAHMSASDAPNATPEQRTANFTVFQK